MTIRKQWLLILILTAIFSVSVSSFVLTSLTDQYFKDYVTENYDKHFDQIVKYSENALKGDQFSIDQMMVELETHLVDPITRIQIYDDKGILIADVGAGNQMHKGMMHQGRMNHGMNHNMMGKMKNAQLEEVDYAEILDGNKIIGQINITKYSSAKNSTATWMFKSSLVKNSLYSMGIVLVFAVIIGILVSKKMSKDLILTADMAQNIDVGNPTTILHSKVSEIRVIQQSLEYLGFRLKLKQKSRKTLIDEFVHQTRTPLTIMKTYLEGIEDGIIDLTSEEISVFENQIENITSIITNMSGMIDAEKPEDVLQIEEIEFSQLLKQIVNGLRLQFEKKNIDLKITKHEKVLISSDQYKISQAIYNVLTNAYKFTKPNGKVHLYYEVDSQNLVLTIEDNGIGISKEEQSKIFDTYFKSNHMPDAIGEGIGLYIAYENLKRINGMIEVDSRLNKGSKFVITIPRVYV